MTTTNADTANPKAAEAEKIMTDIKRTIGHLREGRTTRKEAIDVKDAATRALADMDVARSVRS
jgi:hypothetical protein